VAHSKIAISGKVRPLSNFLIGSDEIANEMVTTIVVTDCVVVASHQSNKKEKLTS
jgi:hypothetical protein